MNRAPTEHHRRSNRLRGYDYAQAGAYFVTICAQHRACLFGDVVDNKMQLNEIGTIVDRVWRTIPDHFLHVIVDDYVVMPNHLHGVLVFDAVDTVPVGAPFMAPPFMAPPLHPAGRPYPRTGAGMDGGDAMNRAAALGDVIRAFKARVSLAMNRHRGTPGAPVWQRNYYEHIIRDDKSLNRIRKYIHDNPGRWASDHENPARIEKSKP